MGELFHLLVLRCAPTLFRNTKVVRPVSKGKLARRTTALFITAVLINASCSNGVGDDTRAAAPSDVPVQEASYTEQDLGTARGFKDFADAVIIGVPQRISDGPVVPAETEDPGSGGMKYEALSIRIEEVLKGDLTEEGEVIVYSPRFVLGSAGAPVSQTEPYVVAASDTANGPSDLASMLGERYLFFLTRSPYKELGGMLFSSSVAALPIVDGRIRKPAKSSDSFSYVEELFGKDTASAARALE